MNLFLLRGISIYFPRQGCKKHGNNIDRIRGESLNGIENIWLSTHVSKFKFIIVGASCV